MAQWCWHIHHDALCEPLIETIEERTAYIRADKPEHEIEIRLRLMQPVKGELPAALRGAVPFALEQEWSNYKFTRVEQLGGEAWMEVWRAYEKAKAAAWPEIEALHAIECPDCPWDGYTIFPGEHPIL